LQIPKRLKIVEVKMYVHFFEAAASWGNRGMTFVHKSSTLEQTMKQDGQALMNPELKNDPESQYKMERMKER
jgi:hypothetical protein